MNYSNLSPNDIADLAGILATTLQVKRPAKVYQQLGMVQHYFTLLTMEDLTHMSEGNCDFVVDCYRRLNR